MFYATLIGVWVVEKICVFCMRDSGWANNQNEASEWLIDLAGVGNYRDFDYCLQYMMSAQVDTNTYQLDEIDYELRKSTFHGNRRMHPHPLQPPPTTATITTTITWHKQPPPPFNHPTVPFSACNTHHLQHCPPRPVLSKPHG